MLPSCGPTQKPFQVIQSGAVVPYAGATGYTPSEACTAFAQGSGVAVHSVTQDYCKWTYDSGATTWPIIKACEPVVRSPFTMSVADGAQLSGLILSVWVSAAIFRWFIAAVRNRGEE